VINVDYLLWPVNDLTAAIVVFRGYRQRMFTLYPVFYAFLATFLISSVLRAIIFLEFGVGSYAYYYAYYGTALLFPIFQMAIIWTIRESIAAKAPLESKDLLLGGFVLSVLALRIFTRIFEGSYPLLFTILCVSVPFVAAFFVVYSRAILRVRRRVRLGRNVKGILLGVGLVTLTTVISHERLYLLRDRSLYAFLQIFGNFCAHTIWVYCLWDRSPSRLIGER